MFWWNSQPRHFPLAQGPYVPGCLDLMSGYTEDATFARIYYPTTLEKQQNTGKGWFKWIPHEKYVEGFAQLINGYATLMKLLVWTYGGEPLVPCVWEAPPLVTGRKLPVIVFSHGFGGTRFISATIAAELASFGFLFASIEHRETSASATYCYDNEADRDADKKRWIPHTRVAFGPNHYSIRNEQLHKRKGELLKLIDVMENINNGSAQNILKSNVDLKCFQNSLDLSNLTMMGHSFGGSATLLTMANDDRLKCGVVLDGWMFPVKEEKMNLEKPLLFINTQSFHIPSNLKFMDEVIAHPPNSTREVYTIRYTTHESQTDSPHVMGYWLDWFQKKLSPQVATDINNHLILRFLHRVLNFPESVNESESYLEANESVILSGTHLFKGQKTVAKY